MSKIAPLRSPLLVWVVLAAAVAAGFYAHWREPMGVVLYTPQDWCQGRRTHAFGLGYVGVLAVATAICAIAWIACAVARLGLREAVIQARLADWSRKALISIAIFAAAMLIAPLFQLSLPLQADPSCVHRSPPPKR